MEPSDGQKSPSAFARERIEKEISHLKKNRSVRKRGDEVRLYSRLLTIGIILGLVWIYIMDPVVYAYDRGTAIHTYLYLHNYGSDRQAVALTTSGLLSPTEAQQLDRRTGSYQDYFPNLAAAEKKAAALIEDQKEVSDLHADNYEALSSLNKFRYVLLIKTGLTPPTRWEFLNPSIN